METVCTAHHLRLKLRDLNSNHRNQKKLQLYLALTFRDELEQEEDAEEEEEVKSRKLELRDFGLDFPIVVINEIMIGGADEFQDLVDEHVLVRIYQGGNIWMELEYLRKCMKCKTLRKNMQSSSCSSCLLRYEWFKV